MRESSRSHYRRSCALVRRRDRSHNSPDMSSHHIDSNGLVEFEDREGSLDDRECESDCVAEFRSSLSRLGKPG